MNVDMRKRYALAYTLAQLERRPPGYTVDDWAVHLLDKPSTDLVKRLRQRVQQQDVDATRLLHEMPQVPEDPPVLVAEKITQMSKLKPKTTLEERVYQKCAEALQPLVGQKRGVGTLMAARERIKKTLKGTDLPFKVFAHMANDGTFELTMNYYAKGRP